MQECLAKPLTRNFSGCLQENPKCKYATSFGFSYLCEHPRHKDFHQRSNASGEQIDHNLMYKELRESRRRIYLSRVSEFVRDLEREAA